jgi:hypothetical protein
MSSPLLRLIGRGALAGAVAGLLSGAVTFLLGEPLLARAIALEEGSHHSAGSPGHVEVFSRATQQLGLIVVALLTGVAIGVLFGIVYTMLHRADPERDSWRRALRLAGAGFVGIALIPFLRYPADPPGVGEPGTAGSRSVAYLGAVLIGLAAVIAAWQVHDRLARRGSAPPVRHLATLAVLLAGLAATWLLPPGSEPQDIPADLLWDFRLASLTALAVLWFGLGAAFGLLGERAASSTGRQTNLTARWNSGRPPL